MPRPVSAGVLLYRQSSGCLPAGRSRLVGRTRLSFSPDAMVRAPIGAHLLGFYLLTGKPIIALGRGDDLLADPLENQLVALERTPDRGDLLATVRSVIPA